MRRSKWLTPIRFLAGLCVIGCASSAALAQLRVANWNVTNYTSGRVVAFQTAIYGSFSGRSMSPDLFIGQEFQSLTSVTNFLSILNTAPGSPGDWNAATFSLAGGDTGNGVFYRASKLTFLGMTTVWSGGASPTQPRAIQRYDFRLVGYTGAGAILSCYSTHMKAQDEGSSDDEARRLLEAQRIRDNAETLPAGRHFLLAGDTNIQRSTDPEYVELVGSQPNNVGRFFDPIVTPGTWNNNCAFRFVHTQDPVSQMDDRHDQILLSANLIDGSGFEYIGNPALPYSTTTWNDANHSYRAWGNDGTSCQNMLTVAANAMVGPTIAQALKDSTGGGGGHIPVMLDLRVPPEVNSQTTINFGTVEQNAVAQQSLTVINNGDVSLWSTAGIANLSYTLAASAGFTAPGGGFLDAAGGSGNNHTISMNTATVGMKNGTVTIASNAPDEPSRIVTLMGNVIAAVMTGDMNCDGLLNNFDIDPFVLALTSPAAYASAYPGCNPLNGDVNHDNVLNNFDIDLFVQCIVTGICP